jgi:hypothetical protein
MANLLTLATEAREAGNLQEAYDYYTKVLEIDSEHYEAWLGKGDAAGRLSTTDKMRLPEVLSAMWNAIEHCPEEEKMGVLRRAALSTNAIAVGCWEMWTSYLVSQPWTDDGLWRMFLNDFPAILDALDQAHAWASKEKLIIQNTITICGWVASGGAYARWSQEWAQVPVAGTVSKEYKEVLNSKVVRLVAEMQKIDPAYIDPAYKPPKSGGCFVATATMGDLNHPTVVLLQQFRDNWLLKCRGGQLLTRWYYLVGPYAAGLIRRSRILRFVVAAAVVRPCACIARVLLAGQRAATPHRETDMRGRAAEFDRTQRRVI